MISSDQSDSQTDIDELEQTDFASCQSGSGGNDTSTAAETQGDGFTPNTSEIGLVAKDGTKWEYIKFSLESAQATSSKRVNRKPRSNAIC